MCDGKEEEKEEEECRDDNGCLCSSLWTFTIKGYAFLWHQVRCMVAVLFLIGKGLESPDVVTTLLDIERTPRKPSYEMASELPLVLFRCSFPRLIWYMNPDSVERVRECYQSEMERNFIQTAIHYTMMNALTTEMREREKEESEGRRREGERGRKYLELMKRAVEPSVEERVKSLPLRKRKRYEEKFNRKMEEGEGEEESEGKSENEMEAEFVVQ